MEELKADIWIIILNKKNFFKLLIQIQVEKLIIIIIIIAK